MNSPMKENVERYRARGLIPSMDRGKGKARWRITYSTGEKEEFMSSRKVKEKVEEGNVSKVEKQKVVVVLNGCTKKDFALQDMTDWRDVSSFYLG